MDSKLAELWGLLLYYRTILYINITLFYWLFVASLRHTFNVMITYLHIRASISKKIWYDFLHMSGIFVAQHMMFYIQYQRRKFHAHNFNFMKNIHGHLKIKNWNFKKMILALNRINWWKYVRIWKLTLNTCRFFLWTHNTEIL